MGTVSCGVETTHAFQGLISAVHFGGANGMDDRSAPSFAITPFATKHASSLPTRKSSGQFAKKHGQYLFDNCDREDRKPWCCPPVGTLIVN